MKKSQITSVLILGFFICTVLFVSLNFQTENSILFCFILTSIVVIYYLFYKIKFLSSTFIFIVFFIMLFFIQPIYYFFTVGSYGQFDIEILRIYVILANVGILLFLMGNQILSNQSRIISKIYLDKESADKTIRIIFGVTILSIVLCFIDAGTLNIMNLSRLELKGGTNLIRLIATFGFYITSIMFFLVFFTVKSRKKSNVLMWIVIFILIELVIFALFRTRSLMVAHSMAVMIGYYYSSFYAYNKYKNLFTPKFTVLLLGVVLFITAISTRFFRGYLQPTSNLNDFNFDIGLFLERSIESGDIGYSKTVMRVIEYSLEHDILLYGQSYYRLLFTVIPRSIWPNKPENTQQIVADWLEPAAIGLSLPPGIIGDVFINFGIFGVILMFVFGFIFSLFDNKMYIGNFLLWGTSATWIFHLVRGGFTNPIITFLVLLIAIIFINKYLLSYNKETETLKI